jgi:hypothetical protein
VHAEFTEYVIQMFLDRAFGNAEGVGNLAVAHSLHQQVDDFPLAIGERRRLARRRRGSGRLTPIALPPLPFAAITYAPVSTLAPLSERPLQTGRRLRIRNCFLSVYQAFRCPTLPTLQCRTRASFVNGSFDEANYRRTSAGCWWRRPVRLSLDCYWHERSDRAGITHRQPDRRERLKTRRQCSPCGLQQRRVELDYWHCFQYSIHASGVQLLQPHALQALIR